MHVDTSRLDADPDHSCFSRWDTYVDQLGKRIQCGSSDVITDEKRALLKMELIPRAVNFLRDLLSVHRVHGKLRLSSVSCGYEAGVAVPEWMRQDGLADADFVIFVTMRPIKSPDTVAYSGHCEVDQTGRPIAAHFNWAPSQMLVASSEFMRDYLARIVLHELTHALVFTPELISYFPLGAKSLPPATDGTGLGFNFEGYYGHGITYLDTGRDRSIKAHVSTPRVALATRRQFGCDSLKVRSWRTAAAPHSRLSLGDAQLPRRVHGGLVLTRQALLLRHHGRALCRLWMVRRQRAPCRAVAVGV